MYFAHYYRQTQRHRSARLGFQPILLACIADHPASRLHELLPWIRVRSRPAARVAWIMAAPSRVFTIRRVARMLNENEDRLCTIARVRSRRAAASQSPMSTTTMPSRPSPLQASRTWRELLADLERKITRPPPAFFGSPLLLRHQYSYYPRAISRSVITLPLSLSRPTIRSMRKGAHPRAPPANTQHGNPIHDDKTPHHTRQPPQEPVVPVIRQTPDNPTSSPLPPLHSVLTKHARPPRSVIPSPPILPASAQPRLGSQRGRHSDAAACAIRQTDRALLSILTTSSPRSVARYAIFRVIVTPPSPSARFANLPGLLGSPDPARRRSSTRRDRVPDWRQDAVVHIPHHPHLLSVAAKRAASTDSRAVSARPLKPYYTLKACSCACNAHHPRTKALVEIRRRTGRAGCSGSRRASMPEPPREQDALRRHYPYQRRYDQFTHLP